MGQESNCERFKNGDLVMVGKKIILKNPIIGFDSSFLGKSLNTKKPWDLKPECKNIDPGVPFILLNSFGPIPMAEAATVAGLGKVLHYIEGVSKIKNGQKVYCLEALLNNKVYYVFVSRKNYNQNIVIAHQKRLEKKYETRREK